MKHNGNLKFEDIIEIAKKLRAKSMAVDSAGTVKEVLGTCVSLGCTVDGKSPKEITAAINAGGRASVGGGKRTNPRVRQSRNDRSGDYFPKTRAKSDGAMNPEQARLPSGSRACSCFTVPRLSRPLGPVGRPR